MAGKESLEFPNVISHLLVGEASAPPTDQAVPIAKIPVNAPARVNKWCIWFQSLFAATLKIKEIAGKSRTPVNGLFYHDVRRALTV
jgi:hypothetical protein